MVESNKKVVKKVNRRVKKARAVLAEYKKLRLRDKRKLAIDETDETDEAVHDDDEDEDEDDE